MCDISSDITEYAIEDNIFAYLVFELWQWLGPVTLKRTKSNEIRYI